MFLKAAAFLGLVLPGKTALLVAGVLAHVATSTLSRCWGWPALLRSAGTPWATFRVVTSVRGCAKGAWVGGSSPDTGIGPRMLLPRTGLWAVVAGRWLGVLLALVLRWPG